VAVCGARRCLAPAADSWYGGNVFFSPTGPGGAKQPANLLPPRPPGRWTTHTQRWQLLAVAESVAGRRACGVPGPCPAGRRGAASEERRTCALCAPRTNTHEGYSAG
jgi:hypothetical protein